ncbi:hypothetical protein Pint_34058 [Pistacia integerrima]|uniref:Uncharacterized protein n=1 Tax=Pistacia integerrima TaxID=434235 RepID=A0ACC0X3Q0_9ROSI|nr:hypothetical protein Pint_34058 [Pistacia integerrima]
MGMRNCTSALVPMNAKKEDCSRVQQLGVTCLAAYAAGAVGTLISNPADNIVASLYNKKAENVIQAVKKIGLFNLFTRSLPVRITIVGPVITMQWLFYDTIKVLTGLKDVGDGHFESNDRGLRVEGFKDVWRKLIYQLKHRSVKPHFNAVERLSFIEDTVDFGGYMDSHVFSGLETSSLTNMHECQSFDVINIMVLHACFVIKKMNGSTVGVEMTSCIG